MDILLTGLQSTKVRELLGPAHWFRARTPCYEETGCKGERVKSESLLWGVHVESK